MDLKTANFWSTISCKVHKGDDTQENLAALWFLWVAATQPTASAYKHAATS